MDEVPYVSFLWYNTKKEYKKYKNVFVLYWKWIVSVFVVGFLLCCWTLTSTNKNKNTTNNASISSFVPHRIHAPTKDTTETAFLYNMCDHQALPNIFMNNVNLHLTVYETSLDKEAGVWKFLFVLDVVEATGSRRMNNDTTIDEFGYYHSWQFNVSKTLKQITNDDLFELSMVNDHRLVKCDHFYTDSFFELLCPVLNYPRQPPKEIGFSLRHALFASPGELRVDMCRKEQTIVSLTHCGAILLNDKYKDQIVRYLHHYMYYGVELFHVFDRNQFYRSILQPYIDLGVVQYHVIPQRHPSLFNDTKRVYNDQLTVFEKCKYMTRGVSEWIVMTDYDEWLTIPDISWIHKRYDFYKYANESFVLQDNTLTKSNVYQLDYILTPFNIDKESISPMQFYLNTISDHARYTSWFHPIGSMPMHVLPPSKREIAHKTSWFDTNNTFESMYNWYVPINFQIYANITNNRTSLMTERFTLRQQHYQHKWAFKAFSRPHLSVRLLEKWAKTYRNERPYPPPERDYIEDDQESYVTMHKMDHLKHDYPRARPAGEIAFAHYISFSQPRKWMPEDGGECIVDDLSVNEPNRYFDDLFLSQ